MDGALSFAFRIFPSFDTAVQLESADSKQNAISKYLFQDSFQHIFGAMRKMHHFLKKSDLKKLPPRLPQPLLLLQILLPVPAQARVRIPAATSFWVT